jgi:formiminoglutamase
MALLEDISNYSLPFLISIPHGGDKIPEEVRDDIDLTQKDIFYDGDSLVHELYDFKEMVTALVSTPVARTVVDVNRAPDDLPPANPDGVIKTVTLEGKSVYKSGKFPKGNIVETLLEEYYFPYHDEITSLLKDNDIKLALDCHTMLEYSPSIDDNPGQARPVVCISNGGDEKGMPNEKGATITCRPEWIQALASSFSKVFAVEGAVRINSPFLGGYTCQYHFCNTGIPWIQIELNRRLYLSSSHSNGRSMHVEKEKIEDLREKILLTIQLFWKMIR